MKKTNAMRLLSKAGVPYRCTEYPEIDADVEDDGLGVRVAALIGVPCERMFKTLALRGGKAGCVICCIPVDRELDLKKAALAAGEKKLELLPLRDLTAVTGYARGGCSPVGLKKPYPVYFDGSASRFDEIAVSAGARGVQLLLNPATLMAFLGASAAELTAENPPT